MSWSDWSAERRANRAAEAEQARLNADVASARRMRESICVLGMFAAVAVAGLFELAAGLWQLHAARRDRRTLATLARHTRRTYGGSTDE